MDVRLRDVAKKAGVGTSTVSKVLNGYTDIAPKTKEKVLHAARSLGYRVNHGKQPTNAISLFVNQPASMFSSTPFVQSMLGSLQRNAIDLGVELRIHPFDDDTGRGHRLINYLGHADIDGLIVVKARDPMPVQPIQAAAKLGLPVVVIGATELELEFDLTCVAPNNTVAAHRVVDYLVDLSHRDIVFIAESKEHAGYSERYSGYVAAMRRHGLTPVESERALFPSKDDALRHLHDILQQEQRPTAVLASNDEFASYVLRLARQVGLVVPNHLSVVGFDDISIARWLDPPLTTNRLPCLEMARLALSEVRRLATSEHPVAIRHNLSCELIIRDSTAPLPG